MDDEDEDEDEKAGGQRAGDSRLLKEAKKLSWRTADGGSDCEVG